MKEINDNPAIEAVITFKGYRHHFPNKDTSIYFFSSEGTDKLKGKDIAVFGTPIIPPSTTLLYATLCGVIISDDDIKKMPYRKVEFDDFTFKFNAYVNPELSRIHLSLIQQELTQAVGRNRYLTEDCTVYLYSSFPIRVFNEKDVKATEDPEKIELESGVEEENIIAVIKPLQPKPIKPNFPRKL
ncbi:MAG: hypothetical protein JZU65_16420 [Chlorobium sp.]|nr:hypothetical protein [Chlorobium sp.]